MGEERRIISVGRFIRIRLIALQHAMCLRDGSSLTTIVSKVGL
jgi:hypothetical protein